MEHMSAGIAGAKDNGIGSVGIAPGARLWAIKVLDRTGSGSDLHDLKRHRLHYTTC